MASKWLLVALVAGALGVGAGAGVNELLAAGEAKQDLKPATSLPLTRVVLFNSGVGYFSRSGEVEGDARVDLTFPRATSTICSRAWCWRTSARDASPPSA